MLLVEAKKKRLAAQISKTAAAPCLKVFMVADPAARDVARSIYHATLSWPFMFISPVAACPKALCGDLFCRDVRIY